MYVWCGVVCMVWCDVVWCDVVRVWCVSSYSPRLRFAGASRVCSLLFALCAGHLLDVPAHAGLS